MESPLLVALKSKLAEWDNTAEVTQASPTTAAPLYIHKSVTVSKAQQIYAYVAQFPGMTASQYVNEVRGIGITPGSSRTLLSQMILVGLLSRDESKRVSVVGKYKTISVVSLEKARKRRIVEKRKEKAASECDTKIVVPKAQPLLTAPEAVVKPSTDILSSLSVVEAKALYLALKELFTV